jgi:hypothetical protein
MIGIKKISESVGSAGRFYLAVMFACAAVPVAVHAQEQPSINQIEFLGGAKGLMLIISGNGPLALGVQADQLEQSTAQYTGMSVKVTKARSALGTNFFDIPEQIPVRSVGVSESPGGGVEFTLAMRGTVNGPVQIRSGGHQVRILLTKTPLAEITWSSNAAPAAQLPAVAPQPVAAQPAPSAEIKPEPVDMKKVEERAVRDMQAPADDRSMFPVKGGQHAQAAAPQVGAARPEVPKALSGDGGAPREVFHDSEPGRSVPDGLVRYKVFGRDPFVPLVKDPDAISELPRVENLRLVGVLEDTRERIALLEDFTNNNRAYALRVNDLVEYGKVLRVHRDKVVFLIRDFDVSRSYTLGITRDAQGGNVRRR